MDLGPCSLSAVMQDVLSLRSLRTHQGNGKEKIWAAKKIFVRQKNCWKGGEEEWGTKL